MDPRPTNMAFNRIARKMNLHATTCSPQDVHLAYAVLVTMAVPIYTNMSQMKHRSQTQ